MNYECRNYPFYPFWVYDYEPNQSYQKIRQGQFAPSETGAFYGYT